MVKMVSHGKHIAIIVQQLNKFNPENQDMEDFLNESAKLLQTLNVTEEKFVLDTLAGCIEYKSLLDVVVNAFFVRDGKYCLISERNLYIAICYLATFQLEELGLQQFSRIVKSLDTAKMQKKRFFVSKVMLHYINAPAAEDLEAAFGPPSNRDKNSRRQICSPSNRSCQKFGILLQGADLQILPDDYCL